MNFVDQHSFIVDSGSENPPLRGGPPTGAPSEADALDAYSQAVIRVVRQVGPAVVGVAPAARPDRTMGSGFVISADGLAITNSHVVEGQSRLKAITEEGDVLDATLLGDDPATDVALLRVASRELPFTAMGDSDSLQVGQLVVAVGNPFGFRSTVSTGVVSATGRAMRSREGRLIEKVVQHTAPLNPGNSGGPLVDSRGRVVGVNTAIIAFAQGLGFAVPANTAKWIVEQIAASGRVQRRTLGIRGTDVDVPRWLSRDLDLLNDHALEVVEVAKGSAAARAGVNVGDWIISAAGRHVEGADDLHRVLNLARPSETIVLEIVRNSRRIELLVSLG